MQQALNAQMKTPGGKVAVISTGLSSIADNGSGGSYAYRTSKCGVNMITKSLSCDLKAKEIAVVAIAPGMVATELAGPGVDMTKMGAKPVAQAGDGIIGIMETLTMETTGQVHAHESAVGRGARLPPCPVSYTHLTLPTTPYV